MESATFLVQHCASILRDGGDSCPVTIPGHSVANEGGLMVLKRSPLRCFSSDSRKEGFYDTTGEHDQCRLLGQLLEKLI